MKRFLPWMGMALLLAGCRHQPADSPLQPHHRTPVASPSAIASSAATPQTWTLPGGPSVTIDANVAVAELGGLRYPNATVVSAVRTHLTQPEYEQTEFTLTSGDAAPTVQAWYDRHPAANTRVRVHSVPTGSRIVILRY